MKHTYKCSVEVVDGAETLNRRVDGDIPHGGQQGKHSGQRIRRAGEIQGPVKDADEAHDQSVRQSDATGSHGAVARPEHQAVRRTLDDLIKGAGAAGNDRYAE